MVSLRVMRRVKDSLMMEPVDNSVVKKAKYWPETISLREKKPSVTVRERSVMIVVERREGEEDDVVVVVRVGLMIETEEGGGDEADDDVMLSLRLVVPTRIIVF